MKGVMEEQTMSFDEDPFADEPRRPAPATPAAPLGDTFTGNLRRVIMFAEDTGYQVLCVAVAGQVEEVKCVGNAVERPSEGLEYEFVGSWTNHPKWGRHACRWA